MRGAAEPGVGPAEERRGLTWWLERGAWSAGDQALFAVSNFAINVWLARRLPAAEYGAFVFAYSTFQLLGQLHIGMVVDPMQVFGAGRHAHTFTRYLRTLLRGHLLFTVPAALVLAAVGAVLLRSAHDLLGRAFLGLAVASPSILLSWLLRGATTIRAQMRLATGAGALNLGLVLAGLALLGARGGLNAFSAFIVMAVANLAAGAWLVYRLGAFGAGVARLAPGTLRDHWHYGRWATGAGLLNWIPLEMFYLVLPLLGGGLGDTAALRAMMNLLLPAVQLQYAAGNLLTPTLVRARGGAQFGRVLFVAASALVLASGVYWLAVGALHVPLMQLLYAGRFVESSGLLWELGGVVVLSAAGVALTSALRALERPDCIFWSSLGAGTAAVACLALVPRWGLAGVAVARGVSAGAFVVALWAQLAGVLRTSPVQPAPQVAPGST